MSNKSPIEFIEELEKKLCEKWCSELLPNKKVRIFLSSAMIAIIDSMPHINTPQSLSDLRIKNEAIEDIEFLSELLDLDCRNEPIKKTEE